MEDRMDLYNEDKLYSFIEDEAIKYQMKQTLLALPLMKDFHKGQLRRGMGHKPYIVHPMMVAKQAISMGLRDDVLIAAALLHDVLEDCDVVEDALPVYDGVKEIVKLVSFCQPDALSKTEANALYYKAISQNQKAAMIKVLDRCNNVSTMSETFSKKKLLQYIDETETYILPLAEQLIETSMDYGDAAFLAKYQIVSILGTIKALLGEKI